MPNGKQVPTRWIAEQHVTEDIGYIPSAADWLREIRPQAWMSPSTRLHLELDEQESLRVKEYDDWEKTEYPEEEATNNELLRNTNPPQPPKKLSF
jgi:hypothetical protein